MAFCWSMGPVLPPMQGLQEMQELWMFSWMADAAAKETLSQFLVMWEAKEKEDAEKAAAEAKAKAEAEAKAKAKEEEYAKALTEDLIMTRKTLTSWFFEQKNAYEEMKATKKWEMMAQINEIKRKWLAVYPVFLNGLNEVPDKTVILDDERMVQFENTAKFFRRDRAAAARAP